MVNYGNGKIYKVICSATGRVYIGSTTVTLSRRMTSHRAPNNRCMTKDFIDGKIFLIEDYPCERKEQLLSRERFFIESMECVNKCRPIITNEETIESKKEYYQKHKDQLNEKKREKISCECGSNYSRSGKSRHFKTEKHIKFSHTTPAFQVHDACRLPSVSVP